ncbi:MAG: hypothetical protein IID03_12430 [Candidatus Dadabacteria bacterium]|nr:hypothetical protein [Candidatus Dadabacteria bacterium]
MPRKKPETILKEVVLKDLKKLSRCYAEKMQQLAKHGTLDIYCTINHFSVILELKKDEHEKLKKTQLTKAYYHARAGAYVFAIHPGNWKAVLLKLCEINDFKHKNLPKL